MRTPPLISVGCFVHYWVSHAIIKYFEVLAYVLPHFDAIIHMLIRGSSAFIFQTLAEVCYSVFVKHSSFTSLLNLLKAYIFQEFAEGLRLICVC